MRASSLFTDLLSRVAEVGRALTSSEVATANLIDQCSALLAGRGEATELALARQILDRFGQLDMAGKHAFFTDMTGSNHLFETLRAGSMGREHEIFARLSDGRELTYSALWQGAEQLALVLQGFGLSQGDRVAVQVEKSVTALELYLATLMAGGIFLPLNPGFTDEEMSYFLGDAEPAFLICDPRREAGLQLAANASGTRVILSLAANGTGTLADAVAELPKSCFQPVARVQDDLAVILYTSGTTGRSKGAMLTHGNLASNALTLSKAWRFGPSDVLIHALPSFHTHAF